MNLVSNMIVIFDATHGSLRLTEPAYLRFEHLLNRFQSAEKALSGDALLSRDIIDGLRDWFAQLCDDSGAVVDVAGADERDGWLRIFDNGSVVAHTDTHGVLRDIEITGRELVSIDGVDQLFYQYRPRSDRKAKAMMSAGKCQPVGDDWNMVYWNPESGETRETIDEGEE